VKAIPFDEALDKVELRISEMVVGQSYVCLLATTPNPPTGDRSEWSDPVTFTTCKGKSQVRKEVP